MASRTVDLKRFELDTTIEDSAPDDRSSPQPRPHQFKTTLKEGLHGLGATIRNVYEDDLSNGVVQVQGDRLMARGEITEGMGQVADALAEIYLESLASCSDSHTLAEVMEPVK